MRAIPTVVLLAILTIAYIGLSLYIVALYPEPATKVNNEANEALESCLHSIDTGRQALDVASLPAVTSNRSTFEADNTMDWAVNQNAIFLHRLQLTSIRGVLSDIEARAQAAVHVTEGLILAWKAGFITTCNMDSSPNLENTTAVFKLMIEFAASYPGFFRHLFFAEPALDNRSHWIECGCTGPTATTGWLWAMGNAQIFHSWRPDPTTVRHDTVVYVSPQPYHVENEFSLSNEFGGFYDWYGEALYDYDDGIQMAFAGFTLPVSRNNSDVVDGYFGALIQLDFLVESMRRSMATPSSLVFIVDVRTNRLVAHTNPNVPQFPPKVVESDINLSPNLYPISEIPDDFIRAAIADLQRLSSSLAAVTDGVSQLEFNGTIYVQVNSVFRNRRLHWLVCQLTNASYFSYDVVEATQKLAESMDEARLVALASSAELNSLNELAVLASLSVASTKASVHFVRFSLIESTVVVAVVLAIISLILGLVVFFLIRAVRRLATQMDLAANLHLEESDQDISTSTITEMDNLWQSFAKMVVQLVVHKQYLPPLVLSPALLGSKTSTTSPLCSPGSKRKKRSAVMSPMMLPQLKSPLRAQRQPKPFDSLSPKTPKAISNEFKYMDSPGSTGSIASSAGNQSDDSDEAGEVALQFHYATVMCVQLGEIDRMVMQRTTSVIVADDIQQFLQVVIDCTQEAGVPISFFGNRVFVVFNRSSHPLLALKAAIEIGRQACSKGLHITIGIATGRLLIGAMGYVGLKTYNGVGSAFRQAARLASFCNLVKTNILVDHEVMMKGRFEFSFVPVAALTSSVWPSIVDLDLCSGIGSSFSSPIYFPTRPIGGAKDDEWMYQIEKQEKDNARTLEDELMRLFNKFRHDPDAMLGALDVFTLKRKIETFDLAASSTEEKSAIVANFRHAAMFLLNNLESKMISYVLNSFSHIPGRRPSGPESSESESSAQSQCEGSLA